MQYDTTKYHCRVVCMPRHDLSAKKRLMIIIQGEVRLCSGGWAVLMKKKNAAAQLMMIHNRRLLSMSVCQILSTAFLLEGITLAEAPSPWAVA